MSDEENNNKPKYVSSKIAKELLQVHTDTLRRWADSGKIASIRHGVKGHRYYDINSILGKKVSNDIHGSMDTSSKKKTICYCRVSSRHQKDDLQRQVASMRERYPSAIIIDDIGSGINWKRKGLQSVIKQVIEEDVGTIVIHHRDRLCRFAYELIEFFFKQFGTSILVLDQETDEPNLDQELSDDLLSIIHIFSCKKMGRRRYKTNQGDNEIEKLSTGTVSVQENSKISSTSNKSSTESSNHTYVSVPLDG